MTEITLLDGSIGQELVRRAGEAATPLWSTSVMMEAPERIAALHRDYLAAGATVLSTNTYPVHRSRLAPAGLEDRLGALIDTALTQAEVARAGTTARIAGCIGPLLASYRPDLEPDEELAAARFAEIAGLMADRVDLFLIETVSSCQEARGALAGMPGGKPVWIAVTVEDFDGTRLRSGEPLASVLPVIAGRVEALLVNCTRPEVIADALPILARAGLPFGAYANGFTKIADAFLADAPTVDVLESRQDLDPAAYADFAMSWVDQGATIVGGCCEVGPAHIAEIARRLDSAGHEIT